MRPKSAMKFTSNDPQHFRQKLLISLSKLNNPDTIKTGQEEIRTLLVDELNDNERLFTFINCLSEQNELQKSSVKREYMKLFGLLAEIFRENILEYYPKILGILSKRIKEADSHLNTTLAETIGAFSEFSINKATPASAQKYLRFTCDAFFEHFVHNNKNNQAGAAICILKMLQATSNSNLIELTPYLLPKLLEVLKMPTCQSHAQVLECMLQIFSVLEERINGYFDLIFPAIVACISDIDDWNTKRIAIHLVYTLAVLVPEKIFLKSDTISNLLDEARKDKVKNVREAAIMTLNLIKSLKGRSDHNTSSDNNSYRDRTPVEKRAKILASNNGSNFSHRTENSKHYPAAASKSPEKNSDSLTINSKRGKKDDPLSKKSSILRQPINPNFLKNAVQTKGEVIIKTSTASFSQNATENALGKENHREAIHRPNGLDNFIKAPGIEEQKRIFSKNLTSAAVIQNFIEENHRKPSNDFGGPPIVERYKFKLDETPVKEKGEKYEKDKFKEYSSPLRESISNIETLYHEIEKDVKALNPESLTNFEGIYSRMSAIMNLQNSILQRFSLIEGSMSGEIATLSKKVEQLEDLVRTMLSNQGPGRNSRFYASPVNNRAVQQYANASYMGMYYPSPQSHFDHSGILNMHMPNRSFNEFPIRGGGTYDQRSFMSDNMIRQVDYFSQPILQVNDRSLPHQHHHSNSIKRQTISPIKNTQTPRMESPNKGKTWNSVKIEGMMDSSNKNKDIRKQIEMKLNDDLINDAFVLALTCNENFYLYYILSSRDPCIEKLEDANIELLLMRVRTMQNDKEIFPILIPWLQQIIKSRPNSAPFLVFKSLNNWVQELIEKNLSEQFLSPKDLFNLKMVQKAISEMKEKRN